jgi:hypothetical protein
LVARPVEATSGRKKRQPAMSHLACCVGMRFT